MRVISRWLPPTPGKQRSSARLPPLSVDPAVGLLRSSHRSLTATDQKTPAVTTGSLPRWCVRCGGISSRAACVAAVALLSHLAGLVASSATPPLARVLRSATMPCGPHRPSTDIYPERKPVLLSAASLGVSCGGQGCRGRCVVPAVRSAVDWWSARVMRSPRSGTDDPGLSGELPFLSEALDGR